MNKGQPCSPRSVGGTVVTGAILLGYGVVY